MRTPALKPRPHTYISKCNRARIFLEALEQRQLLSLLGINAGPFATIPIQKPQFTVDYPTSISYNSSYSATQGEFTSNSTIQTVRQALPNDSYSVLASVAPGVQLQFLINKADGSFGGHNPAGGDDLDVYGTLEIGGVTYDGSVTPLLRADVTQFGFDNSGGAAFDFRLTIVGGVLASVPGYAGNDLGMYLGINPPGQAGAINFQSDFSGTPKGVLGPIPGSGSPPPQLTTVPGGAVVIGSGNNLTDSATVSDLTGNPAGTITFNLYDPSNNIVDTESVGTTGNGTYSTPTGYLPLGTGTYQWVATYQDSNYTLVSNNGDEPEVVSPTSPAINTSQQPATASVGSSIADQATVSGGYNPTGTVTFNLYNNPNGTGTPLFTDANEPLVGGVATSTGYTATATGTDYWVATYNGDSNNISVTSGTALEPVTITSSSVQITTNPGPSTSLGTPNLVITKAASLTDALPFQPVTYTYTVTNTGNAPASNVSLRTTTAPPAIPPTTSPLPRSSPAAYNVGDANHNGLLDPGETWKYTATVIPPVMESEVINGTDVPVGTLTVKQPASGPYAGDYEVIFLQSLGIVDNTYGTNASSGWGTQGHKFSDLLGSDQADFQFTDSKGNVVLDFMADYVSQGSSHDPARRHHGELPVRATARSASAATASSTPATATTSWPSIRPSPTTSTSRPPTTASPPTRRRRHALTPTGTTWTATR